MTRFDRTVAPKALDHVALWVQDRDEIADFACSGLGMHVIERTDSFTLVGADARRGKLTLFAADGPRDPGVLERVVLRVADVDAALRWLPNGLAVEWVDEGTAWFAGPQGLGLGLTRAPGGALDYDLDHVVLRVSDPAAAVDGLVPLGFEARDGGLHVADKHLQLVAGTPLGGEPLLNHLALLVDSADEHLAQANAAGVPTDEIKDAENTYAGFVTGPEGIRIEYVEHKPTFSLV